MKRFINDYSILRAVRTLEGIAVGMAALALWAIMETRWPALADYLSDHPEQISLVDAPEAENGKVSSFSSIPIDLQPPFTDADLLRHKRTTRPSNYGRGQAGLLARSTALSQLRPAM